MKNGEKVGRHAIFELYGCNSKLLDNENYIVDSLIEIAHELGATVLSSSSHKFHPQGVTAILLLSESHISIHTWPENSSAAVDVYTCGDNAAPNKVCDYIIQELNCKDPRVTHIKRV